MKCNKCKFENDENNRYCSNCGFRLKRGFNLGKRLLRDTGEFISWEG